MKFYCRICAGPIENPPDNHEHCIACLGLAHAEAALEESDCAQCADLPLRVLRTRRNVARGLFGVRPTAASVPLVGPPPPLEGGEDNLARSHRSQRLPQSPVTTQWIIGLFCCCCCCLFFPFRIGRGHNVSLLVVGPEKRPGL